MLQLAASGQVHGAIAGDHIFKNSQVSRDTLRQEVIGAGGQVKLAACCMLVSQVIQQRLVVR